MRSIFITGISGMLGNNLALALRRDFAVAGLYHRHPAAVPGTESLGGDLLDYQSLRRLMLERRPDIVVHCASLTNVDAQEKDPEAAWRANVQATRNLLDACRDLSVKFVYISTDSIYGNGPGPHAEDFPASPVNVYGSTKLEAERLATARAGSLVLRTNIYGWNIQPKQGLGEWMLSRLQSAEAIPGFQDVLFSGIYTLLFAEVLRKCLDTGLSGVFNCACHDGWDKHRFAATMAAALGCSPALVEPSTLDRAGLYAPRGKDLRLDVSRLERALGHTLPTMQESLEAFLADAADGLPQRIKADNCGTICGFYPQRTMITYGGQCIDAVDIEAVSDVLKGSNLAQGPAIDAFEAAIARRVDAPHAVAVSSGTGALHIACLAAGVGPGDEVVTTPNTFVASANCAAYCGARPIFADIDPRTYNMSPESLHAAITKATRAVIPVHFAGQSCDMQAICDVVREREREYGTRITIIEDACHALGSMYRRMPVGCCRYSDMTVFSFHPVKHITTAEGGLVATRDPELARVLTMLRSHGIERDATRIVENPGPWYYEQVMLGFHYRITDPQCALGLSQLDKLPWFMARRRAIVNRYNEAFSNLPFLTTPWEAPDNDSNFHLYVACFDFEAIKSTRKDMMLHLKEQRIQTQVHYIPVHLHPYYRNTYGYAVGDLPEAEGYYARCLSLPLHPGMSDSDVEHVITEISSLA